MRLNFSFSNPWLISWREKMQVMISSLHSSQIRYITHLTRFKINDAFPFVLERPSIQLWQMTFTLNPTKQISPWNSMWGSSTLVITEEGLGRWGKKVSGDELFCFPFPVFWGEKSTNFEISKFWLKSQNSEIKVRVWINKKKRRSCFFFLSSSGPNPLP